MWLLKFVRFRRIIFFCRRHVSGFCNVVFAPIPSVIV
jgi:hypothetical protein